MCRSTRAVSALLMALVLLFSSIYGAAPADPQAELMDRLSAHIRFDPNGQNAVGHIVIDDRTSGITQGTWLYVKSALDHYKKTKPSFIILELNTPGGEVYAAQLISDALKDMDTQYEIPIVTFINNWAISAGAMLAYSSRYIAIVKDASMGAAEPVLAGAEGTMVTASEKINSALRADFANRAAFFGRNPLIAEAMVDKDLILVWRDGKAVKLEKEDQIRPDDTVISPKGKLLTLDAEQMMRYGVADILVAPMRLEPITESERSAGRWPSGKMGLFKHPFFERIPAATIDSYQKDWKMRFLGFLAMPAVASLLMMGLLVGFYLEVTNPGMTLPGSIAVICLLLIALSSYSIQAAGWLEVILLLAGIGLVALEVFVLPGFGLIAFAGIVAIVAGLFGLLLPGLGSVSFDFDTNTWNAAGEVFISRLAWLCGSIILSTVVILILWRWVLPTFSPLNRLVLTGEQDSSKGYVAGLSAALLPPPGSKGVVKATLRPAGKVLINGRQYDAISGGDYIEEGEPIIVLRRDASQVVVTRQGSGIGVT